MNKKLPELTVFFPFWNEEKNLEKVVTRAIDVLPSVAEKYEILLIDDGSSDHTLEEAEKIAQKHSFIHVLPHRINRGYGAALRTGFEHAAYKYVVFTDGDLQFDFAEITKFVEKIDEADIVIGFREKRRDTFFRHILMTLLKIWDFIFFRFYFRDIDCGFKMFRREALDAILPLRSEGAMVTTEILAKAKVKKLVIKEVGVKHYPRKFGSSSGGNISVIVRAILETFLLSWDIRNKRF